MADYRMRYKHGDNDMEFGFFNSQEDAEAWWRSMTTEKGAAHKPRDWVLERRDGAHWVVVASHNAEQA